jgi:hypothetical protein
MKAGLKSGRRLGDNRVIRFCCRRILVFVGALGVLLGRGVATNAQPPRGGNGGPPNGQSPVYQRQSIDWSRGDRDRRRDDFRQSGQYAYPQVNSGWFQRPYPTHLDYFRLRSGEVPPRYYGDWYGMTYGSWGQGVGGWSQDGGGYTLPAAESGDDGQGVSPKALMMNTPPQQNATKDSSGAASQGSGSNETLPPPK